ncbi:MAG: RraA family protein [Actinobacteria bacterium]|nr:RraA family protein [Actinomycetota bacterium]
MMLPSRVYTHRPSPPPEAALAMLAEHGSCHLADVVGTGVLNAAIRPVNPPVLPLAGVAVTVRITPGDFRMIPWAVDQLGAGDVLVVDGGGNGDRAVWGDFVGSRAAALGCAAVVVDGAVRDVPGLARLGIPVFARGLAARGPTKVGRGEVNVPVSCGGVCVAPGDVIVADGEGIVAVPACDFDAVLELVRARAAAAPRQPAEVGRADEAWRAYLAAGVADWEGPEFHERRWDAL